MIILTRSSPRLVEKLFEAEVPEIYEGIVKIVSVAREPGARSKIAVMSRDADVDPVGACVGIKGSRVQAVVQELRGEKIDIVPWDNDPARYIINAIQPAEVNKVIVDEGDHRMELVVPDEKLSLAIGRKGQNVRLASQLTGWKLDIISDSKFRQMEDEALGALREIEGVDEDLAKAMYRLGFRALEEIADAGVEDLVAIQGVGSEERAEWLKGAASQSMEHQRLQHLQDLLSRAEPPTEREKLRLVQNVGPHTAQMLEDANYRSVDDLIREDPDKLALRTGLGIKKARAIQEAAVRFSQSEGPQLAQSRASQVAAEQATLNPDTAEA
jgi:N utilization substance protein A